MSLLEFHEIGVIQPCKVSSLRGWRLEREIQQMGAPRLRCSDIMVPQESLDERKISSHLRSIKVESLGLGTGTGFSLMLSSGVLCVAKLEDHYPLEWFSEGSLDSSYSSSTWNSLEMPGLGQARPTESETLGARPSSRFQLQRSQGCSLPLGVNCPNAFFFFYLCTCG